MTLPLSTKERHVSVLEPPDEGQDPSSSRRLPPLPKEESPSWVSLPPGLEDGGRPDMNRADPSWFIEGEITGIGRLKVRAPVVILFFVLMSAAVSASILLWGVSVVGGPVATAVIVVFGAVVIRKKIL